MPSEGQIARNFRNQEINLEGVASKTELIEAIQKYLHCVGAGSASDFANIWYARKLGGYSTPENWSLAVTEKIIKTAKRFLPLIQKVNVVDRILFEFQETDPPEVDTKLEGDFGLCISMVLQMIRVRVGFGGESRLQESDKAIVLSWLTEAGRKEVDDLFTFFNSPLFATSASAAYKVIKWLETPEQARNEMSSGLFALIGIKVRPVAEKTSPDRKFIIMPNYDAPDAGCLCLVRLLKLCNPGVTKPYELKLSISENLREMLERRAPVDEWYARVQQRTEMVAAGGELITGIEMENEITKAIQRGANIQQMIKMVFSAASGAATEKKLNMIKSYLKRAEDNDTTGNGIYVESPKETALVASSRVPGGRGSSSGHGPSAAAARAAQPQQSGWPQPPTTMGEPPGFYYPSPPMYAGPPHYPVGAPGGGTTTTVAYGGPAVAPMQPASQVAVPPRQGQQPKPRVRYNGKDYREFFVKKGLQPPVEAIPFCDKYWVPTDWKMSKSTGNVPAPAGQGAGAQGPTEQAMVARALDYSAPGSEELPDLVPSDHSDDESGPENCADSDPEPAPKVPEVTQTVLPWSGESETKEARAAEDRMREVAETVSGAPYESLISMPRREQDILYYEVFGLGPATEVADLAQEKGTQGTAQANPYAVDSGATVSLTTKLSHLKNVVPHNKRIGSARSGQDVRSLMRGTLNGYVLDVDKGRIPIQDLTAWWCPEDELSTHLLSVRQLVDSGWGGLVAGDQSDPSLDYLIHFASGKRVPLRKVCGQYLVDIFFENDPSDLPDLESSGQQSEAFNVKVLPQEGSKLTPFQIIHLALGHPSQMLMDRVCKAQGIKRENLDCAACQAAKTQFEINREPASHVAIEPGGRVAMDLIQGLGTETANGGILSMLAMVDEYSGACAVFAVRRGDHLHHVVPKALHELFKGKHNVKIIRTDQQFSTNGMKQLCAENGMIHELTVAAVHNQNGKAERLIRTLLNVARASMKVSGGLSNLLPYAIAHAAKMLNLWPTEQNAEREYISPLHKLWGEHVRVQDLPVFGCLTVIAIPPDLESAKTSVLAHLSDRALEAVYLCDGSAFGLSDMLVYDIRRHSVRNVRKYQARFYLNDFPLRGQANRHVSNMSQLRRQVQDAILQPDADNDQAFLEPPAGSDPVILPESLLSPKPVPEVGGNAHPLPVAGVPLEPDTHPLDAFEQAKDGFGEEIKISPMIDTPRQLRSSTVRDTQRSESGAPPNYFKAAHPQRWAAAQKLKEIAEATEEAPRVPVSPAPAPSELPVLASPVDSSPTGEGGGGARQWERRLRREAQQRARKQGRTKHILRLTFLWTGKKTMKIGRGRTSTSP